MGLLGIQDQVAQTAAELVLEPSPLNESVPTKGKSCKGTHLTMKLRSPYIKLT